MGVSARIKKSLHSASLIRRVADEALKMKQDGNGPVWNLSIGNPTVDPPEAFYRTLQQEIEQKKSGSHRYMSNNGYPFVREAMAKRLQMELGIPFTEKSIVMSVGAAGAINVTLKTLLDPGDEVIFFSPYFVEYGFYVENHGGTSVIVDTDESFQLNLEAIEKALTPKTKLILMNSPNNPTGVVYREEDLKALAEMLNKHNRQHGTTVFIMNDSPYRRLVFDADKTPDPISYYDHCFLVSSFSKDLALPGERIGYVAISPSCHEAELFFEGMAFSSRVLGFVNAPALMQHVLPSLLDEDIAPLKRWYQKKRDLLFDTLTGFGYELVKPGGAFYLFPKAPGGDDMAFYRKLKENRVMVVPGSGFGTPGYFRIAYCLSTDILENALPVFEKLAKG